MLTEQGAGFSHRPTGGGGNHVTLAVVGRQQAANVEVEQPSGPRAPQAELIREKVTHVDSAPPAAVKASAAEEAGGRIRQ